MNEFLSEEIPYDLIVKCWDAEIENRPTTKELYQILTKLNDESSITPWNSGNFLPISSITPWNSGNFLLISSITPWNSANPISECFDVQLSESELNEICQDDENNIES
ncbi:unnamed protein product [Rhizophagus irregularis]|nr:unnamed protein product [Rhizophagus irregularis]